MSRRDEVDQRLPAQSPSADTGIDCTTSRGFGVLVALLVLLSHANATFAELPATVVVATSDSSVRAKAAADFVGDGEGDQEEINAAIRALPPAGGLVQLMEGAYDIRRVKDTLGGIIIDRSNVVLAGLGASTKLVLAAGQNTNVIRIIGAGVGDITIRDLCVDANREQNNEGTGDPGIAHDRFEFCGIKAYRSAPRGPQVDGDTHDITIRNCIVKNAHRLGIMLEGPNMRVVDNVLGNAGSDSVEILTGPGQICGNHVEITGQTHVAIGSDRGNSIVMVNNVVHVRDGGRLDIGFRSWADSRRHVLSGNVLTVEPGGRCTLAMDLRGDGAAVTGNTVQSAQTDPQIRLKIAGGNTVVTGNLLENAVIEVNDKTGRGLPIRIDGNILDANSSVDLRQGRLLGEHAPSER
ncbi:MAG: hypothetical protein AB7U20_23575 [Planctomycetaceae bacterium]